MKFEVTISLDDEVTVFVVVLIFTDFSVEFTKIGPYYGGVLNYSKGLLYLSYGPLLLDSNVSELESIFLNCSNGLLFLSYGPVCLP